MVRYVVMAGVSTVGVFDTLEHAQEFALRWPEQTRIVERHEEYAYRIEHPVRRA